MGNTTRPLLQPEQENGDGRVGLGEGVKKKDLNKVSASCFVFFLHVQRTELSTESHDRLVLIGSFTVCFSCPEVQRCVLLKLTRNSMERYFVTCSFGEFLSASPLTFL